MTDIVLTYYLTFCYNQPGELNKDFISEILDYPAGIAVSKKGPGFYHIKTKFRIWGIMLDYVKMNYLVRSGKREYCP